MVLGQQLDAKLLTGTIELGSLGRFGYREETSVATWCCYVGQDDLSVAP